VSVDSAGAEADDESRAYWTPTTISADDRFVTFFTNATNLVADDTNGTSDIFVRDRGLQPDGNNDFLADFGGAGLWVRYNNATWAKRHNASPQRMLATDLDGNGKADLVVDFGGAGLWVKRNNGPWTKIHNATTQDLAAGGFD
jgi:hypothetical protein